MDARSYAAEHAASIERALDAALPPADARPVRLHAAIP